MTICGTHLTLKLFEHLFCPYPAAVGTVGDAADGRKRRAGSEPPPRVAPSIRSGVFSGDGIVAAGRKGVFSRVAEARAAAAQANRLRISRAHGARASSPGGSSASAVSPAAKRKPTFAKVGKKNSCYPALGFIMDRNPCWTKISV